MQFKPRNDKRLRAIECWNRLCVLCVPHTKKHYLSHLLLEELPVAAIVFVLYERSFASSFVRSLTRPRGRRSSNNRWLRNKKTDTRSNSFGQPWRRKTGTRKTNGPRSSANLNLNSRRRRRRRPCHSVVLVTTLLAGA